jgi:hypothetical protein
MQQGSGALNTPPRASREVSLSRCAVEVVVVNAYMRKALWASATRSYRDGQGLRMGEPFDRTYQFIDHIAETLFDAVGQRLLGSLLVFTHALRLKFSMGPKDCESTVRRRFGNSRTAVCV